MTSAEREKWFEKIAPIVSTNIGGGWGTGTVNLLVQRILHTLEKDIDNLKKRKEDLEKKEEEVGAILNDKLEEEPRMLALLSQYLEKKLGKVFGYIRVTGKTNTIFMHCHNNTVPAIYSDPSANTGSIYLPGLDIPEGSLVGIYFIPRYEDLPKEMQVEDVDSKNFPLKKLSRKK